MTTATNSKLKELAYEYLEWSEELQVCDPSKDEEALMEYIAIQEWVEDLRTRTEKQGFTWEQVENKADELEPA